MTDVSTWDPTIVYASGLCYSSVCSNEPVDEMLLAANLINPTGIGPWTLSTDVTFADGVTSNPDQCPDDSARKHYLLEC